MLSRLFIILSFSFFQPLLGQFEDVKTVQCDINELSRLATQNISSLSANEVFQLGVCEYKFENYAKAEDYFKNAEVKGFSNRELLITYSQLNEIALNSAMNKSNGNSTNNKGAKDGNAKKNAMVTSATSNQTIVIHNNSLQHELLNYLFIIISAIGTLIGLRLISKYQKTDRHNIFLGLFIIGLSLMLFELALYWWTNLNYQPKISFFRVQFFIWLPSLYVYLKHKLDPTSSFSPKQIVTHYGIFIIAFISLLFLGNLNPSGNSITTSTIAIFLNSLYLKSAHTTLYFIMLIGLFNKYKGTVSTPNKNWMVLLLSFIAVILILLYIRTTSEQISDFDFLTKSFAAILLSIFICCSGLMLYISPQIITNPELADNKSDDHNPKYKNSGLTEDMLATLKSDLYELLKHKKPHLDNNITLEKLAQELNTDRYSLSQVINQEFGKNFYEFINDYRVEETISIINNSTEIKTVNDLIYESGFNNRVSFYKAFKKRKNMTPMEYIKSKHP
ncbi:helix-turn-helix domain-containing protein [Sediminicola sp. 1XM1-17]|uniref:helix-turn-helix domain-containing protein n=1 Tax=Sediminicola sp. 1XM1-17 TaxID=3127702 RepID=UPI0030780061